MILGIDPGLANTGWAIVQKRITNDKFQSSNENNLAEFELVDGGVIETKAITKSTERLGFIYDQLDGLIKKRKIEAMAMESLFFAKNAKSALKVAEAIGVIKLWAQKNQIRLVEFTPLEIKMALVGYGRAEKNQVEIMVRQFLGKEEPIYPSHAADAAAAALTLAFTEPATGYNEA